MWNVPNAPDSFHALNTGSDDDVVQNANFLILLMDGADERGAGGELDAEGGRARVWQATAERSKGGARAPGAAAF